jgi:hypothetical protein
MEMIVLVEGLQDSGFLATVKFGRNSAFHTGFTSKEQAENWSNIVSKKIEKQHKELMKHEYQALQS